MAAPDATEVVPSSRGPGTAGGLGGLQARQDLLECTLGKRGPGASQAQTRIAGDHVLGKRHQPHLDRPQSSGRHHLVPVRGQKLGCAGKVLPGDRMVDRLGHLTGRQEPARGAAMELRDQRARLEPKLRVQTRAEQVVVAVPVASVIERDHEQIRAREHLELSRRTRRLRDRVTQRTAHPLKDRRAQQQPARIRVEVGQDLLAEVVDDVPVIAGEPHDELVPVGAVAKRQPREIHGCRPALRTLMQRGHVLVGELEPEEIVEQHRGFGPARSAARRRRPRRAAPGLVGGEPGAAARSSSRSPRICGQAGNPAAAASRRERSLPRAGGSRRARARAVARTPRAHRSGPEASRPPGRRRAHAEGPATVRRVRAQPTAALRGRRPRTGSDRCRKDRASPRQTRAAPAPGSATARPASTSPARRCPDQRKPCAGRVG